MGIHAVICSDPSTVLRLPKAGLRNASNWTQLDSDILAHFVQVCSQIQNSRWYRSKCSYKAAGNKGRKLLDHSFPEFEDFVFAAVYLRQIIAERDNLLKDAVTRYCRFVDCQVRAAWVQSELKCFRKTLGTPAFQLPGYTVREVFESFLYGAALMHKIPHASDRNRKSFIEIWDNHPHHIVLYALNASLKILMNHAGSVTMVIYRDYSHWLKDYNLPAPDTRWHSTLFHIKG